MSEQQFAFAQYAVFLTIVLALAKPVGLYLARVFQGQSTWLDFAIRPIERGLYRLAGVNPEADMSWQIYAKAFVLFGTLGALVLFVILMFQQHLPYFFPDRMTTPMTTDLTTNTAVSFATTTTWQSYGGETTMSYFSQMVGLVVQNFLAGAAGLAVGVAFIRGIARTKQNGIGNFWFDLVRSMLYVLMPIAFFGGILLIALGVPMTFSPYAEATTLEGAKQVIAFGPVAALETIKNLGTNGGGFFNVNAAHPFETPTPLVNLVNLLFIAVLPAGFVYAFGKWVGNLRHAWVLLGVMVFLFAAGLVIADRYESTMNPQIAALHVTGENMEGKEVRFGASGTVLAAVTTSNGATGSYNGMHDSLQPMTGLVPLANMLLGEIAFGGLGSGLYSIVLVALVGLFVTGLMIGRTPTYLGKVLGPLELKIISIYIVLGPCFVLILTAISVVHPAGLAGLPTNMGAHGFTSILYAYASAFGNNGQNFAGLSANTPFYNYLLAVAMLAGRFGLGVLALALAGKFAAQGRRAEDEGTLNVGTLMFAGIVTATALFVGGLSFLPAMSLGPIVEQLRM